MIMRLLSLLYRFKLSPITLSILIYLNGTLAVPAPSNNSSILSAPTSNFSIRDDRPPHCPERLLIQLPNPKYDKNTYSRFFTAQQLKFKISFNTSNDWACNYNVDGKYENRMLVARTPLKVDFRKERALRVTEWAAVQKLNAAYTYGFSNDMIWIVKDAPARNQGIPLTATIGWKKILRADLRPDLAHLGECQKFFDRVYQVIAKRYLSFGDDIEDILDIWEMDNWVFEENGDEVIDAHMIRWKSEDTEKPWLSKGPYRTEEAIKNIIIGKTKYPASDNQEYPGLCASKVPWKGDRAKTIEAYRDIIRKQLSYNYNSWQHKRNFS
ncbi:hypothetical protein FRC02_007050 [Tulasnella sp. 418]|nr:hypothetical protein FRC02_007050 [Tulasnella sp. 418]